MLFGGAGIERAERDSHDFFSAGLGDIDSAPGHLIHLRVRIDASGREELLEFTEPAGQQLIAQGREPGILARGFHVGVSKLAHLLRKHAENSFAQGIRRAPRRKRREYSRKQSRRGQAQYCNPSK